MYVSNLFQSIIIKHVRFLFVSKRWGKFVRFLFDTNIYGDKHLLTLKTVIKNFNYSIKIDLFV